MNVGFKTLSNHADGVANAFVRIYGKFVGKDVKHFAIAGQRDITSGIDSAANIIAFDVARAIAESDATAAIDSAYVGTGDANDGGFDGNAGDAFGFFNGAANGADCGIEIDDGTFAQAFGFSCTERQEFDLILGEFSDQHTGLGATDVQTDEIFILFRQASLPS